MEPVNELDIDGYRWEIKDTQARKDISTLKTDSDKKIKELNDNLILLNNEIYNQKKINVILYDKFDIKNDNIQNNLYLMGNFLFGSLYLRFDDDHNPFLLQSEPLQWIEIATVPGIKYSQRLYNCIQYALPGIVYGKGDVHIENEKLLLRIREKPVENLDNWYMFYQSINIKVELIK